MGRLVLLLLACGGCRQILGLEESPAIDAMAVAIVDAPPTDVQVEAPCADIDHDGVCDDQDKWLCGTTPVPGPDTVTLQEMVSGKLRKSSLTDTDLGSNGPNVSLPPGAPFMLKATVFLSDCISTNARNQIEVGYLTSTRKAGCVFDAVPTPPLIGGCATGVTQGSSIVLYAPPEPGLYAVGFRTGQASSCESASNWWMGTPPANAQIVGHLCVVAP